WEELWLRYLIARYDAYNCVYVWTLLNEYEFYPNGDWHYKPVADRWAMRVARWIKGLAPHGHVVAVHNGPREPAFARRFAADPEAIDAILFQEWGTRDAENGWLAAGIEETIQKSLAGWRGSAVFAEYGYERNPNLPLLIPSHRYCDEEHTRRGAWRGAFRGLGVIHGFENSWGPFLVLGEDQPGLAYLLQLRRFFTEIVPFHRLRPAPELIVAGNQPIGHRPLALASAERDRIAVYFPAGDAAELLLPRRSGYHAEWFDPRGGERQPASVEESGEALRVVAPATRWAGHPADWVLVLTGAV
ncbi:MAG TPA: putative collagen-binding domain-containing protein, partial [Chloroflexota bacterium]|nr:putative collagen-binding domain-containing protein [Chloroflexota bacterium]